MEISHITIENLKKEKSTLEINQNCTATRQEILSSEENYHERSLISLFWERTSFLELSWWILILIMGSIQLLLAGRNIIIASRDNYHHEWIMVFMLIFPISTLLRSMLPRLGLEGFFYYISITSIFSYIVEVYVLGIILFVCISDKAHSDDKEAVNVMGAIIIALLVLADLLGWLSTITTAVVIPLIAEAIWVISVALFLFIFYAIRSRSDLI